ncbi:hypothetical protein NIES1031_19275 [Chroogloeocystis siderophila 5.2 s.c.1]|uniref:FecR protein domain-containing protein n=2 Tax=Chroogloeocystis TaxID=329162 RepID=A0A1U7HH78_9CHRO|nr:FecR family protein [Chroogloeocystis siderophila]OKH22905.1 hypothetical protein NIES1031_19275 [Chroogloeocystis siderophila 5.2 s.c.1]
MTLPIAKKANAETALTRAVVQNIRNLVRLLPQNRTPRPARLSDAMQPGDALSTGRSSLAELRFNDGSLARIGEQAIFRFIAQTRRFRLSNGTVLLLIPPGRGVTDIRTPNAAAAIRGSALFVRYIPETDTTIVGALTDSNIEVFNQSASQSEVLEAGQMAVVVNDTIEQLYEFDLNTFYQTSDLVQQLNLNRPNPNPSADPALSSVQAETAAAAATKPPVRGEGVVENPPFVRSPGNSVQESQQNQGNNTSTTPTQQNQGNNTSTTPSPTGNPSGNNSTNTENPPSGANSGNQQLPGNGSREEIDESVGGMVSAGSVGGVVSVGGMVSAGSVGGVVSVGGMVSAGSVGGVVVLLGGVIGVLFSNGGVTGAVSPPRHQQIRLTPYHQRTIRRQQIRLTPRHQQIRLTPYRQRTIRRQQIRLTPRHQQIRLTPYRQRTIRHQQIRLTPRHQRTPRRQQIRLTPHRQRTPRHRQIRLTPYHQRTLRRLRHY